MYHTFDFQDAQIPLDLIIKQHCTADIIFIRLSFVTGTEMTQCFADAVNIDCNRFYIISLFKANRMSC